MRNWLSFLLILLIPAAAFSLSATKLPNPQRDPAACGRKLSSAVCDPEGFLPFAQADTVDGIVNFINAGTHGFHKTVPCRSSAPVGAQLAVAVVSSLPSGFLKAPRRAFKLAKDLHDSWGVGDINCQNGVVLVLAINDRTVGLSVGSGVKHLLTDDMVPAIVNVMKSDLRTKEYGLAIEKGVTAIGNILNGGEPPQERDNSFGLASIVFMLPFCCVFAWFGHRKKRRYARCKKVLQNLDDGRLSADKNTYISTSCPICLEDFAAARNGNQSSQKTQPDNSKSSSSTPKPASDQESQSLVGAPTTTDAQPKSLGDRALLKEKEVVLSCGHNFHKSCIVNWVSKGGPPETKCPICRKPISNSEDSRDRDSNNFQCQSGWGQYDLEYRFRLQRARYFYSDFITQSMVNDWIRNRNRHDCSMATSPRFLAVDPVAISKSARASGANGSSFSYGGGSSSGGGGGGSSW